MANPISVMTRRPVILDVNATLRKLIRNPRNVNNNPSTTKGGLLSGVSRFSFVLPVLPWLALAEDSDRQNQNSQADEDQRNIASHGHSSGDKNKRDQECHDCVCLS